MVGFARGIVYGGGGEGWGRGVRRVGLAGGIVSGGEEGWWGRGRSGWLRL